MKSEVSIVVVFLIVGKVGLEFFSSFLCRMVDKIFDLRRYEVKVFANGTVESRALMAEKIIIAYLGRLFCAAALTLYLVLKSFMDIRGHIFNTSILIFSNFLIIDK